MYSRTSHFSGCFSGLPKEDIPIEFKSKFNCKSLFTVHMYSRTSHFSGCVSGLPKEDIPTKFKSKFNCKSLFTAHMYSRTSHFSGYVSGLHTSSETSPNNCCTQYYAHCRDHSCCMHTAQCH